jgi:deazaflavin-dependent oxidoreductase (nitroreductase family)
LAEYPIHSNERLKVHNAALIEDFRAKGRRDEKRPNLLVLTTIGAKTGQVRLNPLTYLPDSGDWIVFASFQGAEADPAWFRNLIANPRTTAEVDGETVAVEATLITDRAERDLLYERQKVAYPQFADYEKRTERVIPAVRLRRRID